VPKICGFPLTLIVALTTVLRTTVLHCDYSHTSPQMSFTWTVFGTGSSSQITGFI